MLIDLNIGSNIGDRHAHLGQAVALLAERLKPARLYVSDIVESAPWGYDSPNAYLNQGVLMELEQPVEPLEVLDAVQAIEREICPDPHRNPDGTYRDRAVDIDIIDIDGMQLDTPRLQLPHPRMHLRDFVTVPMAQVHAMRRADVEREKAGADV